MRATKQAVVKMNRFESYKIQPEKIIHPYCSFYDQNNYGEEEERSYFSDNETRKKNVTLHDEFLNKYDLIIYFNDIAIDLNKRVLRLVKHPVIDSLQPLTNSELMESQIKMWQD